MALYIALKSRKVKDLDFNRFKSAIHIFNEILSSPSSKFKVDHSKVVFFEQAPLPEFNKEFEWVDFKFGTLESYFRRKVQASDDSSIVGFQIETRIYLGTKYFTLLYELFPRNRNQYYDIRAEILPNGYAEVFEDIEEHYPDLRRHVLNCIKLHNKNVKQEKFIHIFPIRKAVMSGYSDEFHNIAKWRFLYTQTPEEIIDHLSYGWPELRDRLVVANKSKFAETLHESTSYALKFSEYANIAKVELVAGSLALIPKDAESMNLFVVNLRDKVTQAAKSVYPDKDTYHKNVEDSFL